MLKEQGLFLVEDPVTSIARIGWTNRITNPVDAKLLGSDTNQTMPIAFQDVPLDEALNTLIRLADIVVTLDPKVSDYVDPVSHMIHSQPTVSARWAHVTARQGIIALCENYDLVIVKDAAHPIAEGVKDGFGADDVAAGFRHLRLFKQQPAVGDD